MDYHEIPEGDLTLVILWPVIRSNGVILVHQILGAKCKRRSHPPQLYFGI